MFFIKNVDATILSSSWDSTREISKLIQLVEILSALKQDLLIIIQIIIWINVSIAKEIAIFL